MDILLLVGKWILLGVGAYFGIRLLIWLWDEHPFVLILLAAAAAGGWLWNQKKEPEVQLAETTVSETCTSEDKQYRPYWKTGVCQTLSEDAHIITIFIDDAESSWADYTVDWFVENKVEPGIAFIEKAAADYGHQIDLGYDTYVGVNTGYDIPSYTDGSLEVLNNLPDEAAAILGFSSAQEMLAYHREKTGEQQIAYVFCVNKPGRSYAQWSGSTDTSDVETCVIFIQHENQIYASYNAIFHEVLHLFGAEDIYAEGSERVGRESMARQLCPNDIMMDGYNSGLEDVGRFTAYSIGWLDEMPQEYNDPQWWS